MILTQQKETLHNRIILLLYSIFFVGFIFSFRAISSISIMVLMVAGLIRTKGSFKKIFFKKEVAFFLGACALFYLLIILSFFLHHNTKAWWRDLELKSGILFIPLAVVFTGPFNSKTWKKLIDYYCLILFAASIYCLTIDILHYRDTGDRSVFFYHQLVGPLHQHAVFYSIYLFIALMFLLDQWQEKRYLFHRLFHFGLLLFFSAFLVLLSSKIVIPFYIVYLGYFFISRIKAGNIRKGVLISSGLVILILAGLVFFTSNPVSDRFRDVFGGDPGLVKKEKYDPGVYFNGVQFRLLQWKLVPAILNEHKSWMTGVGPGSAQAFLNEEYALKNMWLGDPATGNMGYRAYNTHNQLLETVLRYGIPGLILFLVICYSIVIMILRSKRVSFRFILLLLLLYSCVDTVLERQYGILLFCFFPVFLWQEEREPT